LKLKAEKVAKFKRVPCGACHECCKWDAIYLQPELGDDETDYITEEYRGKRVLAHKENGDCVYLDRKTGCTIHDRAPVRCKQFDCRDLLKIIRDYPQAKQIIPDVVIQAAKRRIKRV